MNEHIKPNNIHNSLELSVDNISSLTQQIKFKIEQKLIQDINIKSAQELEDLLKKMRSGQGELSNNRINLDLPMDLEIEIMTEVHNSAIQAVQKILNTDEDRSTQLAFKTQQLPNLNKFAFLLPDKTILFRGIGSEEDKLVSLLKYSKFSLYLLSARDYAQNKDRRGPYRLIYYLPISILRDAIEQKKVDISLDNSVGNIKMYPKDNIDLANELKLNQNYFLVPNKNDQNE